MIQRHQAQNSSTIFAKRNIQDLPITIDELRQHMEDLPNTKLANNLIHFGTTLRGTKSYWKKSQGELYDLLKQLGTPTIFFTLSVADLYWLDLHALMPGTLTTNPREAKKWRTQNVIDYSHIVAHYMHLRHTMF